MINVPPPLNRDYNRDPNIKALKGGGLLIMGLHDPKIGVGYRSPGSFSQQTSAKARTLFLQ